MLTQILGLSSAEAAQVCACPVVTRSRVARARKDLVAAITEVGRNREDRRATPEE